jgi:hypothetical protein
MRKIAATLVALGLTLGLLGAGISATFTDSASATMSVHVGTFSMSISAVAPAGGSAVVSPDGKSVTVTCSDIQSSAAGSCISAITVTNTGSIPMQVGVAVAGPAAPFTSALGPIPPVAGPTLAQGETYVVNGGLSWPSLTNAQLGLTYTVVYTFSASA